MSSVPLRQAARELGISEVTLRRWIREGCPIVQRGRRGRGCATMVDPAAIHEWRSASNCDAVVLGLASLLPELLAEATTDAWRQTEGLDKRRLAGVMAAGWYVATSTVLDALRELHGAVPEIGALPASIELLQKIARN